jgi:PleD family two-component response regulator
MGKGVRVLLLDDSRIALEFQRMLLQRHGFEVRVCDMLDQVATQVADWRPHVIVSDVDLPEAEYTDLVSFFRTEAATSGIPVVLCSGLPLDELERLSRERGADGFVSKSENISSLPELLKRLGSPGAGEPPAPTDGA